VKKYILLSALVSIQLFAEPLIVKNVAEVAKKNTNWKVAYATGEQEQIVFMNVSTKTNPKNEIGVETHSFDQTIWIVEGQARAVLAGNESIVQAGDLIFIPKGTEHNVINIGKELKLISFYSMTDIPAGSVYKTKTDQSETD
jgi:quercetin dioxygenase-like cupin family protein